MSALSDALASGTLPAASIGFLQNWRPKEPLWRVYAQRHGAVGFNGTPNGAARFSPLKRADASIVPTLYAGTSLDVALMEIVLRDLPIPSVGFQLTLPEPSKEERRVTNLVLAAPLRMVDFSKIGLQRIGLTRGDVIDCNSSNYPHTQALGAWAYANTASTDPTKTAHGIVWTSRQEDLGQAAIFFGDRVLPLGVLTASNPGQSLQAPHVENALILLADRLGIEVVVP